MNKLVSDPNFQSAVSIILPLMTAILAILCLVLTFRAWRKKRYVEDLPTSKTNGVFMGMVELKGTAEVSAPAKKPDQSSSFFSNSVVSNFMQTFTQTIIDGNGQAHVQTSVNNGPGQDNEIKQTANGLMAPFYLKDDCGTVLIQPQGAVVDVPITYNQVNPGIRSFGNLQINVSFGSSAPTQLVAEKIIPLHCPIYVVGFAQKREDSEIPEIIKPPNGEMFLISTNSEEKVHSGQRWKFWLNGFLGLIIVLAGTACYKMLIKDRPGDESMHSYAAVGYLLVWFLTWLLMAFNALIQLRQKVRQAWANIDVLLARRRNLILNLVETIKGYSKHEQGVLVEVARLRSQLQATPPGKPGPDPCGCYRCVVAIAERFPDLKANKFFLKLQSDLRDTEDQISYARGYFNSVSAIYNTRLSIIPDRFIAAIAMMSSQAFMTAEDFERKPVDVKFSN